MVNASIRRAALSVLLCWFSAVPVARAQDDSRISFAAGAGSLTIKADHAEGTRSLAAAGVGVRLTPWADLEGEVGWVPGAVTHTFSGPLIAFGPPATSVADFESRAVIARTTQRRETRALFSLGVRLHPSAPALVRPYAVVGLTGHAVRDTRQIEILRLPPGVAREDVDRALPAEAAWTRNVGGITVGGGVEIAVTRRLSLLPDVRYVYGSFGDEINNALRTTVHVAWRLENR
jgi:hypothetical protein